MTNPPDHELAVFSAARRLPVGESAAYLDEACAGDGAVRQRNEELLQTRDEAWGEASNHLRVGAALSEFHDLFVLMSSYYQRQRWMFKPKPVWEHL